MDKNSKCETALTWTLEGRRKVCPPKTTWRSTIENERLIMRWNSWKEARRVAAGRAGWGDALRFYGPLGPNRIGEVR